MGESITGVTTGVITADVADQSSAWALVAGDRRLASRPGAPRLSKRKVLVAVGRRGLPKLVEATLVPAILFFLVVTTLGEGAAMVAVLAWGYGAILRRVLGQEPIPAILTLATLGLTVRTAVGLLSGSTFVYFLQPVASTVALAGAFLGSVLIGRPIVARLANDFCPLAPEVASRPAVVRLFAGLTVLWAGVHLLTAATTLGLLVRLPVTAFVAFKTLAFLGITVAAVIVTILWALHTARREQLEFARVGGPQVLAS